MNNDDYDRMEKRIIRGGCLLGSLYLIGFILFWVGIIFLVWKLAFSA